MEECIAKINPESVDHEALDQFVKEFYQCDDSGFGMIAYMVLLNNPDLVTKGAADKAA